MTRIVTYRHRYKRPPRKRKAIALEVPAIIRSVDPKKSRRHRDNRAAAQGKYGVVLGGEDQGDLRPTHAERKSAIVTTRRRKPVLLAHLLTDMTPAEHKRRGDAADALFRERRVHRVCARDAAPGAAPQFLKACQSSVQCRTV